MNEFISCDWGTSSFRLRLVNAATKVISAEIKTSQGIAETYLTWKTGHDNDDRFAFYSNIISGQVKALEKQCARSLENMTIVVSGMASSSIGMLELPYATVPFCTDGSNLPVHTGAVSNNLKHPMIITPGVRTARDVIRGEETILIGCNIQHVATEQLFIVPGTHSKHMAVKFGTLQDFNTYLTGELFNLLSTKSILAASVQNNELLHENSSAFIKGVEESASGNLLNSLFHVRSTELFGYHTPKENYHFLSGLLIGAELKDLTLNQYSSITLVATEMFHERYSQALQALGVSTNLRFISADEALVNGQSVIYNQHSGK